MSKTMQSRLDRVEKRMRELLAEAEAEKRLAEATGSARPSLRHSAPRGARRCRSCARKKRSCGRSTMPSLTI